MPKCTKCNKTFKSQYILDKHVNRKYSCDMIFKCDKCKTVFDTKRILDNHLKRKTPCIPEVVQNIEIMKLELEGRKITLREKELAIREKTIEARIREIEAKKEMIELRKQAFIEKNTQIEKLKTERKEKTSIVINNNNTINITNNVIQHIKTNYPDNYDITGFKEMLENTYSELTEPFDLEPYELMLKFYDNHNSFSELFATVMNHTFQDNVAKCLFYFKDLDKFYGIYKKGYETDVRETNFDEELKGPCEDYFSKILDFMNKYAPRFREGYTVKTGETKDFDKQMALLGYRGAIGKGFGSMKNLSAKFFLEKIDNVEEIVIPV